MVMQPINPPSPQAAPKTAKAAKGTFYDLKDVDVSSDGTRVIFAMRGPLPCNLPMRMKRKSHPTETPRREEAPLAARGVMGTAHEVTRPRGSDVPPVPHPAELEAMRRAIKVSSPLR